MFCEQIIHNMMDEFIRIQKLHSVLLCLRL